MNQVVQCNRCTVKNSPNENTQIIDSAVQVKPQVESQGRPTKWKFEGDASDPQLSPALPQITNVAAAVNPDQACSQYPRK